MWDTWDTRFLLKFSISSRFDPEFPWTTMSSRLGWFTSHTGESLLPAGPPLKAFIIHKKWFFAAGISEFFPPPKININKAPRGMSFFFCFCFFGRLPKQLRVHASSYWRKAVEEVRCCVLGSIDGVRMLDPIFWGTVGCASGASILAALLESYRGAVDAERCGENSAEKSEIWSFKVCSWKDLQAFLEVQKEAGTAVLDIFSISPKRCVFCKSTNSFLLKPKHFPWDFVGDSQLTRSTALSKISSSLKFCLACREAQVFAEGFGVFFFPEP